MSGLAQISTGEYLVVHDTKAFQDGPRLGHLQTAGGATYSAIDVPAWNDRDQRTNDLEDVCAIGGRQFLAIESGYWQGRFGRLFHLRLTADGSQAEVLHQAQLPKLADNKPAVRGDSFEGLACAERTDGSLLLFVGERGGSPAYPTGVLRWMTYEPDRGQLSTTESGLTGIPVEAPITGERIRSIAALHIAEDGQLWASASQDGGDTGPFRSAIYRLGKTQPNAEPPIHFAPDLEGACAIENHKIEGLASAGTSAQLAVSSEDEDLGGVWRMIECD